MVYITKNLLSDNVYKIALAICRFETIEQEKSLK